VTPAEKKAVAAARVKESRLEARCVERAKANGWAVRKEGTERVA
jgi:hypothetical protein